MTNNSIGVAGTAGGGYNGDDGITILMIKTVPPDEPNVSAAIEKAVDEDAKVINMSLGWAWKDECQEAGDLFPILNAAVNYAISNDVVLIAAIGNNFGDLTPICPIPYWLVYPAAHSDVISVAGIGSDDVKASYSNYANWCDISAPSGHPSESGILSTFPIYMDTEPPIGYDYAEYGTSYAAPFVSGVAALIRSMAPDADVEMVRAILKQTIDNIDDVNEGFPWEDKIGTGRLNAFNALTLIQDLPDRPTGISLSYAGTHPLITWYKNTEADVKGYNVHAKYEFRNGPNPKNWTYIHYDYFVTDTSFIDINWFTGGSDMAYFYVQAVDIIDNWSFKSSIVSAEGGLGKEGRIPENLPESYRLSVYPNPFNSQVTFKVDLPVKNDIILNIYNLQGQLIKQITKYNGEPGTHYFKWDGKNTFGIDVPSGIYFLKALNVPLLSTKKLILLK